LQPDTTYYYQVGSQGSEETPARAGSVLFTFPDLGMKSATGAWSGVYKFTTLPTNIGRSGNRPLTVGFFGDFGWKNGVTAVPLEKEVANGDVDFIVHAGDIAYDLHDLGGGVGDEFMRMIEPVAAAVAYQVCPGNHEMEYNFSHYRARFHMAGDESSSNTNLYSSFNAGPVHFVSVSTELYFYNQYYNEEHIKRQYDWLQNDLAVANMQRDKRPWVIVYGHRPMYCSLDTNDGPEICTQDTLAVRDGVSFNQGKRHYGLEPLLYDMGVDVYFSGHMHSYERFYPVYREQLLTQSYHKSPSPIHIVAGAAGGRENLDSFDDVVYPYSAVRFDAYGYGKFVFYNETHLNWQQLSDSNGNILDEIWITK